ncbi:unnamed protein product [Ilex paraguariensis]|uniref:Uncharacterized protein n=1 Tax=Ilex paraguariensis TaxID=185542 RepID=A0ABC8SR92_9AQUA
MAVSSEQGISSVQEIIWLLFASPLGFPSKIAEAPEGRGVPSKFSETQKEARPLLIFRHGCLQPILEDLVGLVCLGNQNPMV